MAKSRSFWFVHVIRGELEPLRWKRSSRSRPKVPLERLPLVIFSFCFWPWLLAWQSASEWTSGCSGPSSCCSYLSWQPRANLWIGSSEVCSRSSRSFWPRRRQTSFCKLWKFCVHRTLAWLPCALSSRRGRRACWGFRLQTGPCSPYGYSEAYLS